MSSKQKDVKESTNSGVDKSANSMSMSITDDIRGAEYYHGLVPRADIEPLLKQDGDFIVRKTEHGGGNIILAISVRYKNTVRHFMINQDADGYYFESTHKKSITALIDWHRSTKTPLSAATPAILSQPIERPVWLLNHDAVKMVRKLGEGAFGEVYLAEFPGQDGETTQVAVKTTREQVSRDSRLKFMKEARLMRKLTHKHIVKILGVAVHEHPLMIVMEFCHEGSMLNYLRKHKGKTTLETKLRFATEGAAGLAYLEKQNFIHRDIAARNCLLSEKLEVKISDFGMSDMSKNLTDEKLDKVPVKWLAPETMQSKIYNNKTDIWSYGIMVYEIYSEGGEPYPGLTNVQTRAKIVVLDYRMEMPKDTPANIVKLVDLCWKKDPAARPTFQKIHEKLSKAAAK